MASLFLPFAQVIASKERDEKLSPCVLLGSRNSQEKKGARVFLCCGRKLKEEEF